MSADPKILETIKKLAELANPDNGAFPGEIANASAKMQVLMKKYNVSWAEVLLTKTEQERTREFVESTSQIIIGMIKNWQWGLARAIGTITMTKFFASAKFGITYREQNTRGAKPVHGMNMKFFGGAEQALLAADLFDEWVVLIDHMAREASGEYCKQLTLKYGIKNPIQNFRKIQQVAFDLGVDLDVSDHPIAWRNSWLDGVVNGINNVLWEESEKAREEREAQEAANNTTTALMVITTALELAYKNRSAGFRHANTGGGNRNLNAFHHGNQVGRSLKIGAKKLGDG